MTPLPSPDPDAPTGRGDLSVWFKGSCVKGAARPSRRVARMPGSGSPPVSGQAGRSRGAAGSKPSGACSFDDMASRAESGATAVEFALLGPLLLLLFMGTLSYGGWFWLSISVQSIASEAARAAIAGIDLDESESLARDFVAENAPAVEFPVGSRLDTRFEATPQAIRVRVALDVSDHPLILLGGPLPKPPAIIERVGVVRTGGFS